MDAFVGLWALAVAAPPVREFDGISDSHGPEGPDLVTSGSAVCMKDGSGKRVLPVDVSEARHGEFARLTKSFLSTVACDPDLSTVLAHTIIIIIIQLGVYLLKACLMCIMRKY